MNREIKTKSNKSLIILTESSDNNIYQWASNKSVKDRNVERQISTGYKTAEMWNSILFQIVISFYVMYLKKFTFVDMKLQNNFYIKDINLVSDSVNYFKYVIDDIEYYLPNSGYLLMVDSDNHDISGKPDTIKIIGEFLNNKIDEIYSTIYKNMSNCINHGVFTSTSIVSPSAVIITKINKLSEMIMRSPNKKENVLKKIIPEIFINYLHNRIGQYLYKNEIEFISKTNKKLQRGNLFCIKDKNEEGRYKICMCVSNDNTGIYYINELNVYNIQQLVLVDYVYLTSNFDIKQNKSPNEPYLTNENMIETYYI